MLAVLKKAENHVREQIRFWKCSSLSGQVELALTATQNPPPMAT
jgi:hypothetical protein